MSYKANLKGLPVEVLEEGERVAEGALILVVKVSESPHNDGRSTVQECSGCNEPVWLHATSTEVAPNARLICITCLQQELRKEIN